MNKKLPGPVSPNVRELDRIVNDLERRVMIIGRDQRTFSGISDLRSRAYFIFGFILVMALVLIGMVLSFRVI